MKQKPKFALTLMLIKWGALVVDGRGKLGGHVASANKGGAYLRTKVTPTNPQTTYQTQIRQLFGSISQQWSGLSASARAAWNSAIDEWKRTNIFGDLKLPSGKALFQRLNQQAQVAGYPPLTLPPAKLEMVQGVVTEGVIDIGQAAIDFTGVYAGTDARVMLYSSGPVSDGTKFVKNLMRNFHNDLASTYTPGDGYNPYVERFGTPAPSQKIFIGVKYVLPSGQASPLQIVEATIIP